MSKKNCICHSAVKLLFPTFSAQDGHDLLMCCTCWPFGDCEIVIRQLRKLSDRTNGTLHVAMAYADAVTDEAMRETEEETT